jgi:hypothetical protein
MMTELFSGRALFAIRCKSLVGPILSDKKRQFINFFHVNQLPKSDIRSKIYLCELLYLNSSSFKDYEGVFGFQFHAIKTD